MSGIPKNLKILLVEDDRTMRQIEIHALKKIGYTDIVQAANGDEAIHILQKEQGIHLIISDWNMPKKGGLELLIWVRASNKFNTIPFIMATGQADKRHEKQAVDAGVTGFLVKPFADDEFKSTLNQAFGISADEFKEIESIPRIAPSGKVRIKIAHIQITDHLVMGVLKHLIDKEELTANHFELELVCMQGWNPVARALEQGVVDGACILAPLALDLYSVGTAIKLVMLSHKNGSIFVRTTQKKDNTRSKDNINTKADTRKDNDKHKEDTPLQAFFRNSSFLIPHKMSVHHILSHLFLSRAGLNPSMSKGEQYDMEFEVTPPLNMPEFINKNSHYSGFMVAEPIGSLAVQSGIADCQFLSGELWENHPCCAVVMQKDFIDKYTDAMFELTRLLVKAGKFIADNPDDAAQIAVQFLDPDRTVGLTAPILKKVLTAPNGITTDDLYPVVADLDTMQQYMVKEMGIGSAVNIDEFVDLRFADNSCDMGLADYKPSVLHSSEEDILKILNRAFAQFDNITDATQITTESVDAAQITTESVNTSNVNSEEVKPERVDGESVVAQGGKYLTFCLASEEYGISIRNVKEIIGMAAITHVPRTPKYVKGVINLRGKVIPVMDLRIKFGMESVEYTDKTCILVVEVPSERNSHNVHIGVVVDSVSEVINVKSDDIDSNPKFGASLDTEAVIGMAKAGERVRILLDVEKALAVQWCETCAIKKMH
ncbi:MAG: chemotaxis protein CheW [Desulfamplus sp.]|nr:chemotaxis protein CheW [Desulfamplus sp.]